MKLNIKRYFQNLLLKNNKMDQAFQKLTNMITKKDFIPIYDDIYESDHTIEFEQDIKLKDNVDYKIGFIWGKTTNSNFNINNTNNKFRYYNGTDWKLVNLPEGGYKSINDFNNKIKEILEVNSDNKDNINLTPDTISLKTKFELLNGYKIDFTINNSFNKLLGFDNILLETTQSSTKVVEITLVKNISVNCNLVSSSYLKGKKTNILYRYTIPAPLGYDYEINPKNIIWLPISTKSFNNLNIQLKDDVNKLINLRGYVFSFLILIRQV